MSSAGKSTLRWLRLGLWALVAIAAVFGVYALSGNMDRTGGRLNSGGSVVQIGGAFELTDHTGKPFSSERLKGRPHLVFFGFTHCPDICPTTLQELSVHLGELGSKADVIVPIFITVDPARDTPEKLGGYLSSFDSRITGLSGSEDEIMRVAKLYRAFFEKVESEGGEYTMNHTASVFLFDRSGALVSTLNWEEKSAVRLAKLEKLLAR